MENLDSEKIFKRNNCFGHFLSTWASNGGFCCIPGAPGELRLCYANLPPAKCVEAAERLKAGLAELRKEGPDIIGAR